MYVFWGYTFQTCHSSRFNRDVLREKIRKGDVDEKVAGKKKKRMKINRKKRKEKEVENRKRERRKERENKQRKRKRR